MERKYERFPDLILAHVWFLSDPQRSVTYALTYSEALSVAHTMGWTATDSWTKGWYSTSRPSGRLLLLLEPHRMTPEKWWAKVVGEQDR